MTPEERSELIEGLVTALNERSSVNHCLSEDEQRWVKIAIQKEAQSIELRKAIIEKSLTSLIWAAIVGIGYILLEFLSNHGFKL